jgi:Tfp pilus assembly protein PilN
MLKLPFHRDKSGPTVGDASFLPEDYVQRRNELRTTVISVSLFILVTLGVVGAFLVTNRRWNEVKDYQQAINIRYTQAAQDIEQLKKLEKQRAEYIQKAELTTSLIEKVPRSILLAELINRMPEQMVLLEFELDSERADKPKVKRRVTKGSSSFSKKKGDDKEGEEEEPSVRAPSFRTSLTLTGVTPSHRDVAQYVSSLGQCSLLRGVELIFSESTRLKDTDVFRFRVEAFVRPDIDARDIDPVEQPRLRQKQTAPEPEDLLEQMGGALNPGREG